jgi:hypothetical protein
MAWKGRNMLSEIVKNTSIKKLSVAIAGVCLIKLYIYIMQQDAPHKNKIWFTV